MSFIPFIHLFIYSVHSFHSFISFIHFTHSFYSFISFRFLTTKVRNLLRLVSILQVCTQRTIKLLNTVVKMNFIMPMEFLRIPPASCLCLRG